MIHYEISTVFMKHGNAETGKMLEMTQIVHHRLLYVYELVICKTSELFGLCCWFYLQYTTLKITNTSIPCEQGKYQVKDYVHGTHWTSIIGKMSK